MPRSSPLTFNHLTIHPIIRSFNHSIIQLLAYLCRAKSDLGITPYLYIHYFYAKIIYSVCGGLRVHYCRCAASYFRMAMERLVIWCRSCARHCVAYVVAPKNGRSPRSSPVWSVVYWGTLFDWQCVFPNPSVLRTRPLKKGTTLGVEGLKKLILNIFLFRQVFAPDNRTPQNFQIAEL